MYERMVEKATYCEQDKTPHHPPYRQAHEAGSCNGSRTRKGLSRDGS